MLFWERIIMDGWTIFFVIVLAAALFTTVCILAINVIKKNEKEIRPSKDTASSERIISIAQVKEVPPPDVAVLYEAPHKNVANLCRFCGCEYASPVVICEICGEKLLRG